MPCEHEIDGQFEAALVAQDIEAIRRFPKGDLHNHGVLGGDPTLVRPDGDAHPAPIDENFASMAAMHAWVEKRFGKTLADPMGRMKLIAAAFGHARRDGVTRLEVGDDVWAITLFDGSAEQLTNHLKQARASEAVDIEWIPSIGISRHCPIGAIETWMSPFLDLGCYQSMDLSGDEFAQPIANFKPLFRKAKAAGLRLKAHAGEWGDADSVWRAVEELELDEVQHGIAASQSKTVMRFLRDHHIRLNVCPTSNVRLGRVDNMANHPIRALFDAGIKVTINTDDMLVFGQSVSCEFLNVYQAGCLSERELDQVRQNSLTDDL